jgi:site-specific DNA recombinase
VRDASRFSRRDGDEAFGELKRIAQAGIAVWFYQDATTFEHGNFAANITGIVRAEMNAEFRRQIGKWTREAMVRKAQAGHVAGGRVFGYDLVDVIDGRRVRRAPDAKRDPRASHVERCINEAQAEVVRRIFSLSASGVGYARIARQLNADGTLTPRPQQGRPAGCSPSTVYEVLHRPLYRGEVVWNKTRKRDAEGKTAAVVRPETEWFHVDRPELRIVSEEVWRAAHRRIDVARAQYETVTLGQRRPKRDRDSKYLLTSFGRCACCGGGLHVRSRAHGKRRVFFYACTSHYNKGPAACAHVDQWPMDEIDHEVLGTMTESLGTDLESEITAEARRQFDAHARPDRPAQLRRDLERVEREQARCTEAIATGAGAIPALVARLRSTEAQRGALLSELEQARKPSSARSWAEIERRLRARLKGWRSLLSGDVVRAREGLRQLMATPIQFTPFIDEQGFRAIRFEGRWGLEGVFDGVVTKVASPTGFEPVFWP